MLTEKATHHIEQWVSGHLFVDMDHRAIQGSLMGIAPLSETIKQVIVGGADMILCTFGLALICYGADAAGYLIAHIDAFAGPV